MSNERARLIALESLMNLVYLCWVKADDPEAVGAYMTLAEVQIQCLREDLVKSAQPKLDGL